MPRILIFGAYANGNIGDEYQARSVARHIEACVPGAEVYAASASSKGVLFDFPPDRRIDDIKAINSSDFINGYDALVIGGGGLFAAVHRPLNSPTWPERITVPIVILAVGANPEIAEKCRVIIEKARYVSGRDAYSHAALRSIRDDATLIHDPILSDDAIAYSRHPDPSGLCVIPRKMTDKSQGVYQHLNGQMRRGDFVLSMFPSTDAHSGALAMFPNRRLVAAVELEKMLAALVTARLVVSDRFHGCILALKLGIPCLGLSSLDGEASKIASLYHQLGIPGMLLKMRNEPLSRKQLIARAASFDGAAVARRIAAMGDALRTDLGAALGDVLAGARGTANA